MASPAVEFQVVSKRYGAIAAVDRISFGMARGTLVTPLGPSGYGETTTPRLVAGLAQPSDGRILIAGQDVTHARPRSAPCPWCSSPTPCSRT